MEEGVNLSQRFPTVDQLNAELHKERELRRNLEDAIKDYEEALNLPSDDTLLERLKRVLRVSTRELEELKELRKNIDHLIYPLEQKLGIYPDPIILPEVRLVRLIQEIGFELQKLSNGIIEAIYTLSNIKEIESNLLEADDWQESDRVGVARLVSKIARTCVANLLKLVSLSFPVPDPYKRK